MGKHTGFSDLRLELDKAITYGSKAQAQRLARKALKKAEQKKYFGEIEYFKGQIQILNENFVSAIEHFDAAIRWNPKDGAAYNDRALCMVEIGIIDEAFEYFDRGIQAEPDYATVYHNKGWLLNNIGRHTEAISCFKKALKLEPGRAVTYDNLADALYNIGDYKGSLKAYRKVISLLKPGQCGQIKKQIKEKIDLLESQIGS